MDRYLKKAKALAKYFFSPGICKRLFHNNILEQQVEPNPVTIEQLTSSSSSKARKDNICVVSDFQGKNPLGAIAHRIARGMKKPVTFSDTQATKWLYNPLLCSESEFKLAIDKVLSQISESKLTHLHLEVGMFGKTIEQMRSTIFKIIDNSEDLVVFVHSLHMNDTTFSPLYRDIIFACEKKHKRNTVIMWVNNLKDKYLLSSLYSGNIVYQPVLYFSEKIRKYLIKRGSTKRASRSSGTITIGVFGFINAHKDFETTIRAFCLLPKNYHLVIVGGPHPGERKLHSLNPNIVSLDKLIWEFRNEGIIDRIFFRDDLGDIAFFTEMASLDLIIINYLETTMSASSVLSQALELDVPVVASRCTTFEMAQDHFGKTFELFDPGNSIQLRQKILSVTKTPNRNRVTCSQTIEKFCSQIEI